jgi:hypothetical protein
MVTAAREREKEREREREMRSERDAAGDMGRGATMHKYWRVCPTKNAVTTCATPNRCLKGGQAS